VSASPEIARARARLYAALRERLVALGYEEVETPALVAAPGMEPHLTAFETEFAPEMEAGGAARRLYLHTSPEYAMKRLLAAGFPRIFQICKVFRNGEVARAHNPEFTMLEFYRAGIDYRALMENLEDVVCSAARALGRELARPFARVRVREALGDLFDGPDDAFYKKLITDVEPALGRGRPAYLLDYPARMAALARLSPSDPSVAERFELYLDGVELANGFSELNDAAEQRRRLVAEQDERRRLGRPVYPLDERFLDAVGRMPDAAGVAVGLDRLLMVLTGAREIADVLLFPAREFLR
jgi:lysyl-tRNA synthetase class 2